jgi:hypothetical protein
LPLAPDLGQPVHHLRDLVVFAGVALQPRQGAEEAGRAAPEP